MGQLLQRAFSKAAELPQAEQDRFARFLLAELESERQWAELFARPESEDLLERFAKEALSEHHAGRTQPLKAEDLENYWGEKRYWFHNPPYDLVWFNQELKKEMGY